jgi:hypothetical protein
MHTHPSRFPLLRSCPRTHRHTAQTFQARISFDKLMHVEEWLWVQTDPNARIGPKMRRHFTTSIALVATSTIVAFFVEDLNAVIDLLGFVLPSVPPYLVYPQFLPTLPLVFPLFLPLCSSLSSFRCSSPSLFLVLSLFLFLSPLLSLCTRSLDATLLGSVDGVAFPKGRLVEEPLPSFFRRWHI